MQRKNNIMYEGYPDFQRIIICDDQRFVAAYRQNDAYYLYPQALSILAADPLAFSLDIVRSYSTESLYGWLNFTTQLQFAGEQSLQVFKQQYPDCAVKALPVLPGSLGFDVPIDYHSELYGRHYDTTWYSAQCSQFIILLNAASTQLIERTLLDETIGFNARLDGFVEGVSPRLAYRVEFDARALILALAAGVEGAHAVGDTGIVFPYDGLTLYLSRNLTRLPLDIDPPPPANDPAGDLLLSQALLDRLYNLYGAPSAGPAAGNVAQILLTPPPHTGRTRCDLANIALTQRPLCFTLDPFAAAQQIAKVSPDTIIHRTTAPPLPAGEREINVFYAYPLGLQSGVTIDIQLTVPPGNIYPIEQTQTLALRPDRTWLTFKFHNSALDAQPFFYQIRVNYPQDGVYRTLPGEQRRCDEDNLVLDYAALPCRFLTLYLDPTFAQQSRLGGPYYSADWRQTWALSASAPYFSAPILGDPTFAEATAYSLSGDGAVPLPAPIVQNATIGAYSFPQFGAQQATITVRLPPQSLSAVLSFQPQDSERISDRTFTHSQPSFVYKWNVTSIFAAGFRYKTPTGPWSPYVTGDQTIDIKGDTP